MNGRTQTLFVTYKWRILVPIKWIESLMFPFVKEYFNDPTDITQQQVVAQMKGASVNKGLLEAFFRVLELPTINYALSIRHEV